MKEIVLKKTFREILAEKDGEFSYYIKSTANLHDPKIFALVNRALLAHKVRQLDTDSYKPIGKDNIDFPGSPNAPVYTLKLVTGFPLNTRAVAQEIAMHTRINQAHLLVEPTRGKEEYVLSADGVLVPNLRTGALHREKDKDYKPYTQSAKDFDIDPRGVADKNAQNLVGQKRLGDFMRELQTGRKDREKEKRTQEVYECFSTNHLSLEYSLRMAFLKGYYLIENRKSSILVEGPFSYKPDNVDYRDKPWRSITAKTKSISRVGSRIVTEFTVENVVETTMLTEIQSFEVSVRDTNSGRSYQAVVKAQTEDQAREIAINEIAAKNQLDPTSLLATQPHPQGNVVEEV